MSEVGVAECAPYFGPDHTVGGVVPLRERAVIDRSGEARPSATGVKLVGRQEERLACCHVDIYPVAVFIPVGVVK